MLGSSLVVSPANQLPIAAKQNGAKLVIVNQDPTPLDRMVDLVIQDRKIGEVLRDVAKMNAELWLSVEDANKALSHFMWLFGYLNKVRVAHIHHRFLY